MRGGPASTEMFLWRALSKLKSRFQILKSKLLLSRSSGRGGNNGKSESMVAESSGVAEKSMGRVGGGQLDGGELDGLGGGGDGGGDGTMETIAVDSGSVHVVDWPGHQRVVAVLGLLNRCRSC